LQKRASVGGPGEPLARIADELELDRTSLYRAINPMIRDGRVTVMDGLTVVNGPPRQLGRAKLSSPRRERTETGLRMPSAGRMRRVP